MIKAIKRALLKRGTEEFIFVKSEDCVIVRQGENTDDLHVRKAGRDYVFECSPSTEEAWEDVMKQEGLK